MSRCPHCANYGLHIISNDARRARIHVFRLSLPQTVVIFHDRSWVHQSPRSHSSGSILNLVISILTGVCYGICLKRTVPLVTTLSGSLDLGAKWKGPEACHWSSAASGRTIGCCPRTSPTSLITSTPVHKGRGLVALTSSRRWLPDYAAIRV